jgi:hypothetical protein
LLIANREVSVRAAAAETPTITTVHSKKNFMISIPNTRLGKTASSYEQADNQQKDMLRMVLAGEATVKNPSVR